MLLIFILLFLAFPCHALAEDTPTATPSATPTSFSPTPTISSSFTITDSPETSIVDTPFSVSFCLQGYQPNTLFYVKAYDINNTTYTRTQNGSNWPAYSGSSWSDHPSFTTDQSGNISFSINIKYRSDVSIPENYQSNLKLKIENSIDEKTFISDNLKVIIVSPLPTSTPTSTQTPTKSPTPTLTPTQTFTPTQTITSSPKPTSTIKPSSTPTTPKQTSTPTDTASPTIEPTPEILGSTDDNYQDIPDIINFSSPTSTPSSLNVDTSKVLNILPYFLIVSGGVFLISPTIISKLKK